MNKIKLKEVVYARASEKGNIWNIPLIPYRGGDYELIRERITKDFVKETFPNLVDDNDDVELYDYNGIKALNIVMYNVLDGGVSKTMNMNEHARSREEPLLEATIQVSEDYQQPDVVDGNKVWERKGGQETNI